MIKLKEDMHFYSAPSKDQPGSIVTDEALSLIDTDPRVADRRAHPRLFSESTPWRFETKLDGEFICLVLFDYPLPNGYAIQHADLLLRLPRGVPGLGAGHVLVLP